MAGNWIAAGALPPPGRNVADSYARARRIGRAACETVLWPAGTFARAYAANRRAAIESVIDADPVASCVREIMAQRKTRIGTAADLLCFGPEYSGDTLLGNSTGWPRHPRALAGRLRRAQPGLSRGVEPTVRTVGTVC
jgi:putative DNA primase/helicase